jgi:protein-S-isoprenylcysteine O-methyltransferase Ste14
VIDRLRAAWGSSPRRTFVVLPAAAAAYELLRRRSPVRGGALGVALMAGGYALYRAAGAYRDERGGGGPGFAAEPERLVTGGPYGVVRNPMYLGHLAFLAGLVALTRSPAALAGLALQWQRFAERVASDERRLADRFGHDYVEYLEHVPRWLPQPAFLASPYVLFHRIAEPESARVRLRVVELGLKSRISFENADTDAKDDPRLGSAPTPALWDGRGLISGADVIEQALSRLRGPRQGG